MKKLLASTIASLAIPYCTTSLAADLCQVLSDSIEQQLKVIAQNSLGGIGDNSAPRETNRNLEVTNAWLQIQLSYELARDHKCPPRNEPFSYAPYFGSALSCATEKMKGNYKAPECDLSTWKKVEAAPAPATTSEPPPQGKQ